MDITYRDATKSDREIFLRLWHEMLSENYGIGGEILPTQENVEVYGRLFDAYVTGQAEGVALLAEGDLHPVGVLLWGDSGKGVLETRWGRIAMGWGTYVDPFARRLGVASELRRQARARCAAFGFDSVLGTAAMSNEAGLRSGLGERGGFKLHGITGVIDLHLEGAA